MMLYISLIIKTGNFFYQYQQLFAFQKSNKLLFMRILLYSNLIEFFYQIISYLIFIYNPMQITAQFRNTILGLLVITGALNTLAYKYQNRQLVYQGSYYKYFFHPYMQATTMFIGQFLCLLVFFGMKKRDPQSFKMRMLEAKSKGKQVQFNPLWLAIPAFFDFITSTMQYIALNFISGSVYQMLRGGVIVTTAMFSYFFLKMKIKRFHLLGCIIAIIGILIVGASNVIFADHSGGGQNDAKLAIIGYILIIASLFSNGFFFVFEEKLFSKYHLEPFQVVGYEGLFGLGFYAITLPIISFVKCNFGVEACVIDHYSFAYLERPQTYFSQAGNNISLLIFIILGIFSIASFNICGVTVTKYINSLARSLADVTRTIIIWTVGIIITVTAGVNHPNYKWELVSPGAIILQLVGFVVLVFGNLIYNKIIQNKFLTGEEEIANQQEVRISLQPGTDQTTQS